MRNLVATVGFAFIAFLALAGVVRLHGCIQPTCQDFVRKVAQEDHCPTKEIVRAVREHWCLGNKSGQNQMTKVLQTKFAHCNLGMAAAEASSQMPIFPLTIGLGR